LILKRILSDVRIGGAFFFIIPGNSLRRYHAMTLQILSPAGDVKVEGQSLSRRDTNLANKTVVFFSNAKPNVGILFDHLEKLFAAKFPDTRTARKGKENAAFAAPEEYLKEAADEADLVIYGVGD
jgi:hypothetical protein